MTNRKLAKMIVDYLPFWELEHTNNKDNYKDTLQALKNKDTTRDIYNYIYNEEECGTVYTTIINELKKRI